MTNHTEVLNYIIETKGYKRYLELGTQYNMNFHSVSCRFKTGVDPDPNAKATHHITSDAFFEQNKDMFDVIFIDGEHTAEQVRKDFINSMKCLAKGGVIVMHDTSPLKEEWTHVPRDSKQWTGNIYQFICNLMADMVTLPFDYGITIVKKCDYVLYDNKETSWADFDRQRKSILNIVTIQEFKEWV